MWNKIWHDLLTDAIAFGLLGALLLTAMGVAILVGRWRRKCDPEKSGSRLGPKNPNNMH